MGRMEQRWIADDGSEFKDERSMRMHELGLVDNKLIDAFLEEQNVHPKKKQEYRRVLIAWQEAVRKDEVTYSMVHDSKKENDLSIDLEDYFNQQEVDQEDWKPENYQLGEEEEELRDIEASFSKASRI